MRMYLDANFFIIAAFDSTHKGNNARQILSEIKTGKKYALTSILALDEVMYVLIKMKLKDRIRSNVEDIYRTPNVKIVGGSPLIPIRAMEYIEQYSLKPRDAFHVSFMEEEFIDVIVSDDADFDKVKGIKRISLD